MSASVPNGAKVVQNFRYGGVGLQPHTPRSGNPLQIGMGSSSVPLGSSATSPRRAVIVTKGEITRPASPQMTPRDVQQYCTPRLAYNRQPIRQQSMPPTTPSRQAGTDINLATRQASQQPYSATVPVHTAVSPEANYRDISVIYEAPANRMPGNRQVGSATSDMDLLPAAPVATCSLEELNIAIQGVMQTLEEERAVRANEVSDLRRDLYQALHQERETHSREFNELKSDVTTQQEAFVKEIIRRSVYEARLQNDVEQICKDPQEARKEMNDRFAAIDRELENIRSELVEPLRVLTEQVVAKADAKPMLGPEVLSDPRMVELMVASTESSIQMVQQQIHDLVGQKIEAHLGSVNDTTSLFGMVREALTNSRQNADELGQVKDILCEIRNPEPGTLQQGLQYEIHGQAELLEEEPCGKPQMPVHKVKRREYS